MMRLRPIVRSALCFLLCLTVCVVPALAANDQYADGFFYWGPGAYVNVSVGSATVDLLNGYFPASSSGDDLTNTNASQREIKIRGKWADTGSLGIMSINMPQMYYEVLFSVPAPLTVTLTPTSFENVAIFPRLDFLGSSKSNGGGGEYTATQIYPSSVQFVYDNEYVPASAWGKDSWTISGGSHDVKRYFGYRFYTNAYNYTSTKNYRSACMELDIRLYGLYAFSDPNYQQGIYDEVIVNTGILQEINGTLTDIKTSTVQIQSDVTEIKDGLQDSNSSIWGAFKDSVSGLFVPSSQDLESVKSGFDQLAQDKLGGAYQSVDLVKNGVGQVRDKMNNPTPDYSVEFPGIEVPLGEQYGTVRLIGRQDVIIPQKMRDVLYPIAGIIIPIVCTTWTVRLGIDMVNCFMSGMSYAQFLHRFTDSEDDEA